MVLRNLQLHVHLYNNDHKCVYRQCFTLASHFPHHLKLAVSLIYVSGTVIIAVVQVSLGVGINCREPGGGQGDMVQCTG